jgi:hypothetical protein
MTLLPTSSDTTRQQNKIKKGSTTLSAPHQSSSISTFAICTTLSEEELNAIDQLINLHQSLTDWDHTDPEEEIWFENSQPEPGDTRHMATEDNSVQETPVNPTRDKIDGTPFVLSNVERTLTDDMDQDEPISAWTRDEKDQMSGKDVHKYQNLLEPGIPGLFKPLNFHLLGNDLSERKSLEIIQSASDNLTAVKQFERFLGRYGCTDIFTYYKLNGGVLEKKMSILHNWNVLTLDDILQNDRYFRIGVPNSSKESVRRDLTMTMQSVVNSIADNGLKQEVLAEVFNFPVMHQTGPVLWYILMRKVWKSDDMTFQTIKSKLFGFKLEHVPGMNVPLYIIPWQVIKLLLDSRSIDTSDFKARLLLAFTRAGGAQPRQFKSHFETLKTMQDKRIADLPSVMKEACSKYESLVGEGVWPQEKQKQSSVFSAQQSNTTAAPWDSALQDQSKRLIEALISATKTSSHMTSNGQAKLTTHDRSGNLIDRTPPRAGEAQERTKDGKTEHWCGECGRWGNHSSGQAHTDWVKKMRELKEKFRGRGKGDRKSRNGSGKKTHKPTGSSTSDGAGPTTRLVIPSAHFSYHLNF